MIEAVVGDFPVVRAVETQYDRLSAKKFIPTSSYGVWLFTGTLCASSPSFTDYVVSGQLQAELSQPHDSAMNTQKRKRADPANVICILFKKAGCCLMDRLLRSSNGKVDNLTH